MRSATGNVVDHYGDTYCVAYPNGEVLWVPPSQFQVFCDLNLRTWPFDVQSCHLTLGSWTYDGDHVDIHLDKQGSDVSRHVCLVVYIGLLDPK
jgi:nicotinic acetylcholine receptor